MYLDVPSNNNWRYILNNNAVSIFVAIKYLLTEMNSVLTEYNKSTLAMSFLLNNNYIIYRYVIYRLKPLKYEISFRRVIIS